MFFLIYTFCLNDQAMKTKTSKQENTQLSARVWTSIALSFQQIQLQFHFFDGDGVASSPSQLGPSQLDVPKPSSQSRRGLVDLTLSNGVSCDDIPAGGCSRDAFFVRC